jgi:hypothetical protein
MSKVKCASILDWKKRKSLSVNQSSNTIGQSFAKKSFDREMLFYISIIFTQND